MSVNRLLTPNTQEHNFDVFHMKKRLRWFVLTLAVCSTQVQAANHSNEAAFIGCYEVVSKSSSNPAKLATGGVPDRFRLTDTPTTFSDGSFQLTAPTATSPYARQHHLWRPRGHRLEVQFGWGLGGEYGVLKPSGTSEFRGKLKSYSDSFPWAAKVPWWPGRPVINIRVRRVECPKN